RPNSDTTLSATPTSFSADSALSRVLLHAIIRNRLMALSPIRRRLPIRVVLSSDALLPFVSVGNVAALAIAQLGVAAFFIAGITPSALGSGAGRVVRAPAVAAPR